MRNDSESEGVQLISHLHSGIHVKRKIVARGARLHEVGARVAIMNLALSLGIDRLMVYNEFVKGEQAVVVLAEGDGQQIEALAGSLQRSLPERAKVSAIEWKDYGGTIPPIERAIQIFQMEHWGKAIPILLDIRDEIRSTRAELGEKVDSVGEKVDKVGEKVDSVGEKVDKVGEKVDSVGEKVDKVEKAVREEGRLTREELRRVIFDEIADLKVRVSKLEKILTKKS